MNKEIDENLLYIRKFSKINLSEICRKLNITKSNIYNGKISKEKSKLIKESIESEIAKLYLKLDDYIDPEYWSMKYDKSA